MSATITLAKRDSANVVQPINDVDKQGFTFDCTGCSKQMIVAKSELRKIDLCYWQLTLFI